MKNSLLLVALCSSLILWACGGGASGENNGRGGGQAAATHFSVTAVATVTAGTAFSLTVAALDASNNVTTSYSGTVHFTSTDRHCGLPADSTLVNGTKTFSVTLNTAGSQTITATDTVKASLTGTSSPITVSPVAGATHFSAMTPVNATAGAQFNITVTALDALNHTVTTYSGTVHFTSTDNQAVLRVDYPFTNTNGTQVFPVTLKSLGNWTITVFDVANASITGTSNPITVTSAPPPSINTSPPPPDGKVNNPYDFTFTATGGAGQLFWAESGALPPTMSLLFNGSLVGIPKASDTFPITVMVQDSLGEKATPQDFTIQILPSRFSAVGSMHEPRSQQSATLLSNGQVLFAGGTQGVPTATSSAEVFDPSSGSFTSVGSMTVSRYSHTATLLMKGSVLIAGGYSNFGPVLLSAELFDPGTGSFTATGNMTSMRRGHTATLLNTGKVLIVGGFDGATTLASAELFNPSTGSFTPTGSMKTARSDQTATLLPDGRVLVTGGDFSATAELYDPEAGMFTPTGNMTSGRTLHTATLLKDGRVLVIGGTTTDLYDPSTGIFSRTGNPKTERSSHTARLLNDGTVLVAGGAETASFYCPGPPRMPEPVATASVELYDPASGTFSAFDYMTTERSSQTATLLNNADVLMAGGIFWTYIQLPTGCFKQTTTVTTSAELFH